MIDEVIDGKGMNFGEEAEKFLELEEGDKLKIIVVNMTKDKQVTVNGNYNKKILMEEKK